jgi:hypothetical protein
MGKLKDLLKPRGKINIKKVYINKKNGQASIILPKKKLKSIPSRVEVRYW